MDAEFEILNTDEPDGTLMTIGPTRPNKSEQIWLPRSLVRRVRYGAGLPEALITLQFVEDRYEIAEITVRSSETYVSSQFLARLALPKVIRAIVRDAIPHSHRWSVDEIPEGGAIETPDFLAQLYWFEYISWGSPRASIMKYTGWSRPNANWHIRKISKHFRLPGPHSDQG